MEKTGSNKQKVKTSSYIALIVAMIFFSGVLASKNEWWAFLDFTKLSGSFGTMMDPAKNNFQGAGGSGIRHGFLFALSLVPNVMFALGFMEIVDHYGGLDAGQKLFSPILRPIMGVPGNTSLALITTLQSMDAGGAMMKELFVNGLVTEKEQAIIASFALSGGGTIVNYFAVIVGLFPYYTVPIYMPLLIVFLMKFVGANLMRLYLNVIIKEKE